MDRWPGFPLTLPQLSVLFNNETPSNKKKQFYQLLQQNNSREAQKLVDFSNDQNYFYDYLFIASKFRNTSLLNYLITNGIDVDTQNNNGETLLYNLAKSAEYCDIIEFLVDEHAAKINVPSTCFHPILASLTVEINIRAMTFFMNRGADLNVVTAEGETCLIKLVHSNTSKPLKWYCGKYITKYGKEAFINHLNTRNFLFISPLDVAFNLNKLDVAKYLIIQGAQLPPDKIIRSFSGTYLTILLYSGVRTQLSERFVLIKRQSPTFPEFRHILSHALCRDWSMISFKKCQEIFLLPFRKDIILLAADKCCVDNMTHDIDSIKYFCQREVQLRVITNVQRIRRYITNSQDICKKAALTIQRFWRRKKYRHLLVVSRCVICMACLDPQICTLLQCQHIFHKDCLVKWRFENNVCPICKTSINKPPFTL